MSKLEIVETRTREDFNSPFDVVEWRQLGSLIIVLQHDDGLWHVEYMRALSGEGRALRYGDDVPTSEHWPTFRCEQDARALYDDDDAAVRFALRWGGAS